MAQTIRNLKKQCSECGCHLLIDEYVGGICSQCFARQHAVSSVQAYRERTASAQAGEVYMSLCWEAAGMELEALDQ